ncbi:hypothetical protein [Roseateles sp. PN1]|uniref:hypothetical protein n=1 Tax=Roseateles sp. PN1 TaxID=3137372 RepID=UPI0031399AFF
MAMNDDFFAPPAFKAEEALLTLKRNLRDMRSLQAQGDSFSLQGQVLLMLSLGEGESAGQLHARLAKRPAQRPEWDVRVCKSSADVRALLDEIKRRLARWTDETP